jgi:hypothetical protein
MDWSVSENVLRGSVGLHSWDGFVDGAAAAVILVVAVLVVLTVPVLARFKSVCCLGVVDSNDHSATIHSFPLDEDGPEISTILPCSKDDVGEASTCSMGRMAFLSTDWMVVGSVPVATVCADRTSIQTRDPF